jgi:hypothetical protein
MSTPKRILKQGPVDKQTKDWRKLWKARWFVLDTEEISYYRSEKAYKADELAVHCYRLDQVLSVEIVDEKAARLRASTKSDSKHVRSNTGGFDSRRFRIKTHERVLELRVANGREARDWVAQLCTLCPRIRESEHKDDDGMMTEDAIPELAKLKHIVSFSGPALSPSVSASEEFDFVIPERENSKDHLAFENIMEEEETDFKEVDYFTMDEFYETLVGATNLTQNVQQFQDCTLLYHKCFLDNSESLLVRITEMFLQPSEKFSDPMVVLSIRVAVLDLITRWVDSYPQDFAKSLQKRVIDFIPSALEAVRNSGPSATAMEKAIKELEEKLVSTFKGAGKFAGASASSPNFLRKFADAKDIATIDPKEAAEQLTLYEWELFSRVTRREFINGNWIRKGAEIVSPNIYQMTESFNKMIMWIGTEILKRPEQAERNKVMRIFVTMGCECLKLGNYWGAFEIASGLWLHPIYRMSSLYEALPKNNKRDYNELVYETGVQNGDFTEYRRTLRDGLGKSQIPQVPLHLNDLMKLDSLDTRSKDGKLNMSKYLKQFRALTELLEHQRSAYHIEPKDEIRLAILKGAGEAMTKDEMTKLSFQYEPKKNRQAEQKQ